MTNKILPQKELDNLSNLFKAFKQLKENHNAYRLTPEMLKDATDLEQIHTALYLDLLHEVATKIIALEELMTMPEEDFIRIITKDGAKTLDEVKADIMLKMFLDIIEEN